MRDRPELSETFDDRLPLRKAQVVWGTRHEMARQVEDILARRSRSLLLNARASVDIAPEVAQLMADELGEDDDWVDDQVEAFEALAQSYILKEAQPAS